MKRTYASGFTLIEVMVAMVIMVVAITVLATTWSGNVNRVEASRISTTSAMLLERKVTEIEIQYKDKSLDEIKEEDKGDFGKQFSNYTWEMESQKFEMPNVAGAIAASNKDEKPDEMTMTILNKLTDVFKESVKEVKVTVIYTSPKSKRELKNSVTTYFIDYAKDISLGAGIPGAGAAGGSGDDGGGGGGGTQ